MKRYRQTCLAFLAAFLATAAIAVGIACSNGAGGVGLTQLDGSRGTPAPPGGLTQLEHDTGISWTTMENATYGTTAYLFPTGTPPVTLAPGTTPTDAALAFLAKYGGIFSLVDPAEELTPQDTQPLNGFPLASFTQSEGPAAVYGTFLTIVFDPAGHVLSVLATTIPNLHAFPTRAALSADEAAAKAQADMMNDFSPGQQVSLEATPPPVLTIYVANGTPKLVYGMLVSYALDTATDTTARQRWVVFYLVDANTGAVVTKTDGFPSQYTEKDVLQVVGTGVGELHASREFPILQDQGNLYTATPYHMQTNPSGLLGQWELFARVSGTTQPALASPSVDSWDTAIGPGNPPDPGSAVDAYYWLVQNELWWQRNGRNGWDGRGTPLGVLVHDKSPSRRGDGECFNNAYWDMRGTIHVCPWRGRPPMIAAVSVDLGAMAHEFQHAVNQAAFGTLGAPAFGAIASEGSTIDESLGDVFGELLLHDTLPSQATCLFSNTVIPRTGGRNMVNPSESILPAGQPDFYFGPRYVANTTDPHLDDGVPNRAWSLMTFGGADQSHPERQVAPSLALGWDDSKALYLGLVASKHLGGANPSFHDLAIALDTAAKAVFASSPKQQIANACAWYAVGVLEVKDLKKVGVAPCQCNSGKISVPGSCDAGPPDSGLDAGYDAHVACLHSTGSPIRCEMDIVDPSFGKAGVTDEANACSAGGGSVVDVCPSGTLWCHTSGGLIDTSWVEVCYYPPHTWTDGCVVSRCGADDCDGGVSYGVDPGGFGTCTDGVQPWPSVLRDGGAADAAPDAPSHC